MSYPDEWGQNIHPTTSLEIQNYSLFPDQDGYTVVHTMLISVLQEIRELKAEIQSLKASEGHPPHAHQTPSLSVVTTSAHYAGDTAVRPSHYPPSILWNLEDTRSDPHVVLKPKNPSRIPMASSLRHENGDVVAPSLYKAIRASGQVLVENVLFKDLPKDITYQNCRRTKRFFMDNYKGTWDKVIHQYETEQPLLRLCAGHWKAEHMLGAILANNENKECKIATAKVRSKMQQKKAEEDEVITTSERRRRNRVVEDEEYESQKEETGEARQLGECRNGVHYDEENEDVKEDKLMITPVS
jgi:hypothetical protein